MRQRLVVLYPPIQTRQGTPLWVEAPHVPAWIEARSFRLPPGPRALERLLRLIGKDRDTFLKGRQSENQSLGIGAYVYYRRVVDPIRLLRCRRWRGARHQYHPAGRRRSRRASRSLLTEESNGHP